MTTQSRACDTLDVLVVGRICIDIYPEQIGVGLPEVRTFSKSIGGSATNVAVAVAQLGNSARLVTRTGDDPFGEFARAELARLGVDTEGITAVPGMQSVLTFCEIYPPDDFPLYIYRNPTAPDMYLGAEDLPLDQIKEAPIFWATATGLSREPSRAAHHTAWAARGHSPNTVLDLDYRAMFWDDEHHAHTAVSEALDQVTVTVGNLDECRVAVGETDADRAADALLERGVELAIVKKGPQGVLARTRNERVESAPIAVDVANGLGAGDAFGGALCHGLLHGLSLQDTLDLANAAGALVATRRECSLAMPTLADLTEFASRAVNIGLASHS
ncbi:5-dehydro-2-deoxygluconokinase [Mycolicibacterium sp. P9-22]|uniref:5-dehydro-2-deoxygluconokinase n=1 Tax=Mycolicibacterium sp. P9-22 TaxID=2024613 RepID=UPI0011EC0D47|nr:5-dehydro-2-deoxygluconokinase [Mycolicibacterium sp. P9-22]KAA0109047.1 5-dehydro-2-deoxygluconokinase [Mycolicibacterium sp. P9-22]